MQENTFINISIVSLELTPLQYNPIKVAEYKLEYIAKTSQLAKVLRHPTFAIVVKVVKKAICNLLYLAGFLSFTLHSY